MITKRGARGAEEAVVAVSIEGMNMKQTGITTQEEAETIEKKGMLTIDGGAWAIFQGMTRVILCIQFMIMKVNVEQIVSWQELLSSTTSLEFLV
jgi:hypothetical protein